MKGAMRELKKDTKFLAREKLGKQMRLDEARKRKVREIMGGLASFHTVSFSCFKTLGSGFVCFINLN